MTLWNCYARTKSILHFICSKSCNCWSLNSNLCSSKTIFAAIGRAQAILDQVSVSGLPVIYAPPILCNVLLHAWGREFWRSVWSHNSCLKSKHETTGLFNPSVTFQTPLNSWQDVQILIPFEWVNKHTGRFVLRYNNAWYMARWLYQGWE